MVSRINKILFTKYIKHDSKERLEHFLNLVYFATVDGNITDNEQKYLFKLGLNVGLSITKVSAIIDTGHEIEFVVPIAVKSREILFNDMIELASLDGVICQKEKAVLYLLSNRMGYTQREIELALFRNSK